jgi:hypothetical protein
MILGLTVGCTPMLRKKPPTLSGTFSGSTPDGRPIRVSLHQDENAMTGRGLIGDRGFILSGLASLHGPMILTFEDGSTGPAYLMLSANGDEATIQGLGTPTTVKRGGEPLRAASGPFAGRYGASGPPSLLLTLTQGGDLLAGTGFVEGQPVAVVGKVNEPNRAAGTLLFSDGSQNRVKVVRSSDGQTLTIQGLGGPIEMWRK